MTQRVTDTRHPTARMSMSRLRLDETDIRILAALQRDGRMTKVRLAESVNLSPSPCWERLRRLEDAGVIAGYHARINLDMLARPTTVLVELTLRRHRAEDFASFEAAVCAVPEILDCWATGGGVDYMMRVVAADVDTYQRLIDRLLMDEAVGIDRYFTYIVTKPVKQTPDVPVGVLLG